MLVLMICDFCSMFCVFINNNQHVKHQSASVVHSILCNYNYINIYSRTRCIKSLVKPGKELRRLNRKGVDYCLLRVGKMGSRHSMRGTKKFIPMAS